MSDKVTIKIPRQLYNKLKIIIKDTGFNSVTEFIVYVMRDLAAENINDENNQIEETESELSQEEIKLIKKRLKNLGYL